MINSILSLDVNTDNVGFHIVDEWVKIFSEYFEVPVKHVILASQQNNKLSSLRHSVGERFPLIRKAYRFLKSRKHKLALPQNIHAPLSICFPMNYYMLNGVASNENYIPVFLDISYSQIRDIIAMTRKMKLFYVTSRSVFSCIKEVSPSSNVRYMPLSVPDIYYSKNFADYRNKTIDVIQLGRRNSILHEYMLQYCSDHKDTEYVYAANGTKYGSRYVSTTRGEIGVFIERSSFMKLLSQAKVSLTAPSGSDPNPIERSADTGSFPNGNSFASPRFYESAIMGCALIGYYPDNEEFRGLNMSRYCPSVASYEHFCECLERALAQTPEELYAQNHEFIINSLTSKRAEQIQRDLAALTGE